ncbi:iron oxidase [Bradyrhizobium sp. NP1]|uniref:iron oxidase n=1 Tax=Bradyrhizobium sp. NP1 TaxID=3049772 RepID=UPI0025A53692|nr:iron oxidase [Bradyrhizobium sp. NP1]WJR80078.1 iron oxidase [Bradyrhizobium sp. NP1]
MAAQRTRRKILSAAVAGASTALFSRLAQAQASDKMTLAQAEYQDHPNGIYSCGMCTLFVAPKACKVVEGEVSRDGWCKAFALAD